jgi:hypothetical protein
MNPGQPRRPFGLGTYVLMILGVGIVGGLAGAAQVFVRDLPGTLGLVLTAATVTAAMAVGFAACVWWWRGIDEAAREAHKVAWWWGGSGGMAIGLATVTVLTIRYDGSATEAVGMTAPDLISSGMWIILLFQLAGYTVAWAIWWLKHR